MTRTLQKRFWLLLTPALAGLGGVWFLRQQGVFGTAGQAWPAALAVVLFVLAVVFAGAVPILGRAVFAHRVRHRRRVSEDEFYRFQQRQLLAVMATPYLALAAYALAVPIFYLAGTVLATLYALYYHYPSQQRTGFDRRIFRVK